METTPEENERKKVSCNERMWKKNKGEWHRVKDKDYREKMIETEWAKEMTSYRWR